MGQLDRISVGKLLYESNEDFFGNKQQCINNTNFENQEKCKTIKRNFSSHNEMSVSKKQKLEETTLYVNICLVQ